jgi:hypothetical protein
MTPPSYHPYRWKGVNRASSTEMTLFGLISLFNFIACGSLFLTFLYLSYKPLIRSYLKRSSPEEKRLARQRTNISEILPSLNLLLICTTSCIPWIFLYLDHDVAYATKAPPFGVCLTQGSMVMTWAAFVSGGAACVITKVSRWMVYHLAFGQSLIPSSIDVGKSGIHQQISHPLSDANLVIDHRKPPCPSSRLDRRRRLTLKSFPFDG